MQVDGCKSPVSASTSPDLPSCGLDRICGNCSYLLVGLPDSGTCPECGESYRAGEIVLRGWAGGVHQTAATAPPKRLWATILGSSACLITNFAVDLFSGRWRASLVWVSIFAGGCGWMLYRRRRLLDDFGGTCHLRLARDGIAQRVGFGPIKLIPWLPGLSVVLKPASAGIYRLTATRPGPRSGYREGRRLWPIDFEFECSSSQAAWLQDMLDQFRGVERSS